MSDENQGAPAPEMSAAQLTEALKLEIAARRQADAATLNAVSELRAQVEALPGIVGMVVKENLHTEMYAFMEEHAGEFWRMGSWQTVKAVVGAPLALLRGAFGRGAPKAAQA